MDPSDLASGQARLSNAVQSLRHRVAESQRAPAPTEESGEGKPRAGQVDIVRKLDLLQKLTDVSNGADGSAGSDDVSLQDRVFHSMVLEKLPDFSRLGPSPLARGVAEASAASGGGKVGTGASRAQPDGAPDADAAKHATSGKGDAKGASSKPQQPSAPGRAGSKSGRSGSSTKGSTRGGQFKARKQPGRGGPSAKAGGASKGGGGGGRAGSGIKEIVIPLGPERLSNIEIHRVLKNEYAVRYCEQLNIAPTAANVADVNRRMPLSQCVIRQVIHPGLGRGERKNYVSIIPPCYKAELQRQAEQAAREQRLQNSAGAAGESEEEEEEDDDLDPRIVQPYETLPARAAGEDGAKKDATAGATSSSSGGPVFEDYKHRFVHPFNLTSRFESDPDNQVVIVGSSGLADSAPGVTSASASRPPSLAVKRPVGSRGAGGVGASRSGLGFDTHASGGTFDASRSGGAQLRTAARAAVTEDDAAQQRQREVHGKRMATYDATLAKLKRGEKLGTNDVDTIRQAVADERPMAVTAAHIQALDELLGTNRESPRHAEVDAERSKGQEMRFSGDAPAPIDDDDDDDGDDASKEAHGAVKPARRSGTRGTHHSFNNTHEATMAPSRPPRSADTAAIAGHRVDNGNDARSKNADAAAQRELDAYESPSGAAEVRALQSLFVRDFPFASYFSDHGEVVSIKAALCADDVTELIRSMLRFVFITYVAPKATVPRAACSPPDVDDAFVDFYSRTLQLLYTSLGTHPELAGRHGKQQAVERSMASGSGFPSDLHDAGAAGGDAGSRPPKTTAASFDAPASRLGPMVVLLLRVALDQELRVRTPNWLKTPTGAHTAVLIDNLAMAIVDPLNLLSHISVVDSTPHAMRVMQTKRRPPRVPPLLTSPLTHFVLGEPQSASAKTMARRNLPRLQRGLRELEHHLTPMARARLLQTMVAAKFHGDAQA